MISPSYQLNFAGYWREPEVSGLPSHSGVYCAYTCTNDPVLNRVTLDRLIYIGEAGDVRDRVAGHEGWDAWHTYLRAGQQICFSTAPVNSTDRLRVEAALIHHHQPPANTEYKSTFPFGQTVVRTNGRNLLLAELFTVNKAEAMPPWGRLSPS